MLEVKGGGVRYQQGCWYTLDRAHTQHPIQHPFKQAESALHAIVRKIRTVPQLSDIPLPIGYGVVFPDVEWHQAGAEWERRTICDLKNFRNCERWLAQLFHYWQQQPHNGHRLSTEHIEAIKKFLRPDFEQLEPLNSQLDHLKQQLVTLTEAQYRYLDIAAANPRVLCSGGAGTGKTFLAAELARRLAAEGCQVVFICKSNWLRRYLEARIASEKVMLSTLDSIGMDQRRAGITQHDVLIVDEGQDLFSWDALAVLDDLIRGGLAQGQWYIFHDTNHQAGLLDPIQTQELMGVLERLQSYLPVQLPLSINCRNSTPVIDYIEALLQVSIGRQGTGFGPEVRIHTERSGSTDTLQQAIEDLLAEGIDVGEITVLSPLAYAASSISLLPPALQKHILQLDDYSVRKLPASTISFAEIRHFKGLENEVIIVIDLPPPDLPYCQPNRVNHYVALTRARSLLVVIWRESPAPTT